MYNSELREYKQYLEEEAAPNCDRKSCLVDKADITRFINNGWVIKFMKEATRQK